MDDVDEDEGDDMIHPVGSETEFQTGIRGRLWPWRCREDLAKNVQVSPPKP